ncbi:hypothetical protein IWX49DRAFT_563689 [Phyllosticta citricarpa]
MMVLLVMVLLWRHALRVRILLIRLKLRPIRCATLEAGGESVGIHRMGWVRSRVWVIRRLMMVVVHGDEVWCEMREKLVLCEIRNALQACVRGLQQREAPEGCSVSASEEGV